MKKEEEKEWIIERKKKNERLRIEKHKKNEIKSGKNEFSQNKDKD